VQQYRMNSTVSVLETLIRELQGQPGMLRSDDGLPYVFNKLLTPEGMAYAEVIRARQSGYDDGVMCHVVYALGHTCGACGAHVCDFRVCRAVGRMHNFRANRAKL
jgi:hypothetical protein